MFTEDHYLAFVKERHAIFTRRQDGLSAPWTDDPVLGVAKFTNVFRVLDPGSQYVLRMVSDPAPLSWGDRAFRAWAYRFTNRPEPWDEYLADAGEWPTLEHVRNGLFREVMEGLQVPVFGTAYNIHLGREGKGITKLEFVIRTAEQRWTDDLWLWELEQADMPERHALLKQLPRVADFMAMQVLTDIGYFDPSQDEDSFIVPGPGAVAGAKALGMKPLPAIYWGWHAIEGVRLELAPGVYRQPSLMDVQNTFCEFSKYARYVTEGGRPRAYTLSPQAPAAPRFPSHWMSR